MGAEELQRLWPCLRAALGGCGEMGAVGTPPRPAHRCVGGSPPQEYAQSRFQLYFQQKGQLTSLQPPS